MVSTYLQYFQKNQDDRKYFTTNDFMFNSDKDTWFYNNDIYAINFCSIKYKYLKYSTMYNTNKTTVSVQLGSKLLTDY